MTRFEELFKQLAEKWPEKYRLEEVSPGTTGGNVMSVGSIAVNWPPSIMG